MASGALAQSPTPAPASAAVVINLIRLLVQEGVLTQSKADALIRQALDEAAAAARNQPPTLSEATRNVGSPAPTPTPPPPASVHVTYVPEIVKDQIRDEVKDDVIKQAKAEHWAEPNALPEWTKRFHLYGDLRLRYEWDLFDPRNRSTGTASPFPNFPALNNGNPFDLNNQTNAPIPTLNTTVNRERMRVRARLGLTADISDEFSAGIRLATGNTTNPVSTNQTLGTDLNKDNFLLDLAYLQYKPNTWLTMWAGRMPNPWFSTDLVWSNELAFDGIAATIARPPTYNIAPFLTAGAFPIENTAFNFPDNTSGGDKQPSRDKWLYGAQAGLGWRPYKDLDVKFGLAYYYFSNIDGKTSSPCDAATASITCNTDNSRPGFAQQGNTYFAIRNTSPVTAVEPPNTNIPLLFQYFGLATPFHELNATARFDYKKYDPVHIILDGDFVTNLAFDSKAIAARIPVNNRGPSPGIDPLTQAAVTGPWAGGSNGFMAKVTVGHPQVNERWDWNMSAAYKYLETDAVLDAFTDSDFHLGGTNAKGYILGGNLGIAHNVYVGARWFSASEISGLPYTVNVVQLDLNGRF